MSKTGGASIKCVVMRLIVSNVYYMALKKTEILISSMCKDD